VKEIGVNRLKNLAIGRERKNASTKYIYDPSFQILWKRFRRLSLKGGDSQRMFQMSKKQGNSACVKYGSLSQGAAYKNNLESLKSLLERGEATLMEKKRGSQGARRREYRRLL